MKISTPAPYLFHLILVECHGPKFLHESLIFLPPYSLRWTFWKITGFDLVTLVLFVPIITHYSVSYFLYRVQVQVRLYLFTNLLMYSFPPLLLKFIKYTEGGRGPSPRIWRLVKTYTLCTLLNKGYISHPSRPSRPLKCYLLGQVH